LVIVAPVLARGGFLDPRVLAVVHAFTLGVITTTIFGALYQMLPPLLGVSVRSVRVAGAGLGLLGAGTLMLVTGLWRAQAAWQGAGWTLVGAAIGCASWTLLPQRRKATQGRMTGLYISAGHSALGLAFLLAGARIGEGLGWWRLERLGMLSAHFHLAALGFATLTAVGVSSRIVPMFLATDRAPLWPLRWIGPLAGIGLVVFATGQIVHYRPATLTGAALLAVAMTGYLALVATWFRRRTRRCCSPMARPCSEAWPPTPSWRSSAGWCCSSWACTTASFHSSPGSTSAARARPGATPSASCHGGWPGHRSACLRAACG
jgi:hypothetical protein